MRVWQKRLALRLEGRSSIEIGKRKGRRPHLGNSTSRRHTDLEHGGRVGTVTNHLISN